MSTESVAAQLQRIADDAIAQVLPNPALDTFQDELLETAAQRIERQLTPLCVCEEHGGYDVERAVNRAAEIVRALKTDGSAGLK